MLTLGEYIMLVEDQVRGDQHSRTPQMIRQAIEWALQALAGEAARAAGPHMLYEHLLDLEANVADVTLPLTVRHVKSVHNVEDDFGYTHINYDQQYQVQDTALYAPSATAGGAVYWITHRKLHLFPTPSSTVREGLRVAAYSRPPVPRTEDDPVGIPPEAERWVIVAAAARLLPPPDGRLMEQLAAQHQILDEDLRTWLWKSSSGIPTNPTEDGLL